MITRLIIDRLFGLYSYDLDFTNEDGSMIKILTGPNGYGKTSIMRIINALYTREINVLFSIPFQRIEYQFDGARFIVEQERVFDTEDDSTDIASLKSETLKMDFYASEDATPESFSLDSKQTFDKDAMSQFNLFMNSRGCFYISDDRLISYKTDMNAGTSSVKKFFQEDVKKFKELLVKNCYNDKEGTSNSEEFTNKLNLFKSIISDSAFADKKMIVQTLYGIRFKSTSELGEFLDLENLSSGEKHILIQAMELLFMAQDGMIALVDEPELSFHPAWLNQYIGNLQNILKAKSDKEHKFQIIIATHSPQLIGQRWDMTIDLYENRA